MPNNNDVTTSFKVDISELKQAMQDAKRAVSVANSEFKAASASMDDWAKSSDGINAKLKQLDSNLKSQKTILSSLERQYELTVQEMGEGSKAADDLRIKINNQKAVVSKTEKEFSQYEEALQEVSKAEKIAAATGKDVAEVLDDVGKEAKDAGEGFTTFKGAVATFAGNVMTGFVNSIKNGISSFAGLAEETREYRTELGKLETAFTTAGHRTETATKTYKDLYAVLGDEGQTVEAANMLAQLCDTEAELAKWTNIATGVYGTFGASLPIEGLAEAANETAKTGKLTGSLADALNWAGISEDEFNESLERCTSEGGRQALITKTLNGLYSEAAKKYKETNASVMEANRANSDYSDTMAELGERVEPITTSLKTGFNGLLKTLLKLVGDVDISAFTAKIDEGFTVLSETVLPAVKDGLKWILDNKDSIIAGLAGIAGGFAAFKVASLINTAVDSFRKFKVAQEGATVAQWLMNAAMNANPIMLIVTLVAALIAGIVTFIATNDEAKAKLIAVWNTIKEFVGNAITAICDFFTKTLPQAINVAVEWFKELPGRIWEWLVNAANKVGEWAINLALKAKETGAKFLENIVTFFMQLPGKIKEFLYQALTFITAALIAIPILAFKHGKEFFTNLIDWFKQLPGQIHTWLTNAIAKVTEWASNMQQKAKDTAVSFLNTVVNYIKELPGKIWTWLTDTVNKVTSWASNMASKAKETAISFVDSIVNFIKELPGKIWTWLQNVVSKVVSWGSSLAAKGREAANQLINSVVNTISSLPEKVVSIGADVVRGIWNGITSMGSWIENKISGFVGDVETWLKDFFGIGSPSKLMRDEIGRWIPAGIAEGITKNSKSVLSSVRGLTENTVSAARNGLTTSGGAVSSGAVGGTVNNFYQTINSPKQLSRLDIYRQSKNLLGYAKG